LPASRAPWWLYVIAASFLGYFALQIYVDVWGPERVRFVEDDRRGSITVLRVTPDRPGARAGDRILSVDGVPIRSDKGYFRWISVAANFEPGRPIPMQIQREGKQIELNLNLRRRSLSGRSWNDWQLMGEKYSRSFLR